MISTRGSSKLTDKKRKELILKLCRALVVLKTPEEVAEALTDLLTPKEIETIAKRLQIADGLVNKQDYVSIRSDLKVGYSTIARVNTWLNLSGKGYKIMFTRLERAPKSTSNKDIYDPYNWHNIKRRYTMHFLPQLMLEEILQRSDRKQKQKIEEIMTEIELKSKTFSNKRNKKYFEQFTSKSTHK